MIILNENKLSDQTIISIKRDYEIENLDKVKFDIDEFKDKLVKSVMDGIKIELKLK